MTSKPTSDAVARITRAVHDVLSALDAPARRRVMSPFDAPARREWHYAPRARPGLPLEDMSARERAQVHHLLAAALSPEGHAKVKAIMALEEVLREIENRPDYRRPLNYALAVYGEPGGQAPWGWRIEGHHVSLHFTIAPPDGIAVTPAFFGANPGEVRQGPKAGLRVLAAVEDEARAIVGGLEAEQRDTVVIAPVAPPDIITGPGRESSLRVPEGLPLAALNEARREAVMALVARYAEHLQGDLAEAQLRRISEAGVDALHLAWAGPLERGAPHYYRIHGPTTLIELDNTQNQANHVHTVWHDLADLFGEDTLRRHHLEGHRGHTGDHAHD